MFCSKCGQVLPEGATFCSKCGTVQGSTNPNPTQPQQIPAQQTISVNVSQSSTPNTVKTKAVNKIAYALFAFFLGGFGAHKFYAGKTTQGIIYCVIFVLGFVLFAIPSMVIGIISIVEAIIALTKPADANGNIEI